MPRLAPAQTYPGLAQLVQSTLAMPAATWSPQQPSVVFDGRNLSAEEGGFFMLELTTSTVDEVERPCYIAGQLNGSGTWVRVQIHLLRRGLHQHNRIQESLS